jgi:threonine aldolase
MERLIDLRSDTVTKPTPAMREAMAKAEVGDDVFGEDPTVNALQERVAKLLGKEASIFVPSGTMANQLAIRALTHHGDEAIIEEGSHPYNFEGGAAAAISGVQFRCLHGERGILRSEQIEEAIRPDDHHYPPTRLICLENTHNRGGGTIYPLDEILRIKVIAEKYELLMHLDGARLLNATVATGIKPSTYAEPFDSVTLCLSKGLGAPIGSMVAGSKEFINRVHRYRKMFGGGMRQVGIIAAAGLYALEHHVERLKDDHEHARILALALSELPKVKINPEHVETNIVIFELNSSNMDSYHAVEALKAKGILLLPVGKKKIRAVTHLDISRNDIELAIKAFREIFA